MHDDKKTPVDIWREAGVPSIKEQIGYRQLMLVGRIVRLPDERIEKQMLKTTSINELEHEGYERRRRSSTDEGPRSAPGLKEQLWKRVKNMFALDEVCKKCNIPKDQWQHELVGIAERPSLCKAICTMWSTDQRKQEDKDKWRQRHALGGRTDTRASNREIANNLLQPE